MPPFRDIAATPLARTMCTTTSCVDETKSLYFFGVAGSGVSGCPWPPWAAPEPPGLGGGGGSFRRRCSWMERLELLLMMPLGFPSSPRSWTDGGRGGGFCDGMAGDLVVLVAALGCVTSPSKSIKFFII